VRKSRRGYTLIELALVLALLVILAALALPVIESMQAGPRLTAAADTVRANLSQARSKAIEDRRSYRFAVKAGTGEFRVAPDSSDFWADGSAGGGAPADPDEAALVVDGTLPEKVSFDTAGSGGTGGGSDWTTVVTFQADGTAAEDAQVSFHTQGASPATLRLRAATGLITEAALPFPGVAGR
jgi:prepilin-type N-terminal cleavage/methylation domain-containing protein